MHAVVHAAVNSATLLLCAWRLSSETTSVSWSALVPTRHCPAGSPMAKLIFPSETYVQDLQMLEGAPFCTMSSPLMRPHGKLDLHTLHSAELLQSSFLLRVQLMDVPHLLSCDMHGAAPLLRLCVTGATQVRQLAYRRGPVPGRRTVQRRAPVAVPRGWITSLHQ